MHSTCGCGRGDDVRADLASHLLQRRELLFVDQFELGDKVVEMFVAGVDVRLRPDAHDAVEVVNVNMNEHPIKSRQDLFALRLERFREGNVCRDWEKLEK